MKWDKEHPDKEAEEWTPSYAPDWKGPSTEPLPNSTGNNDEPSNQYGGEEWTEEDEQDYRDEQNFDPPFPEEEEANEWNKKSQYFSPQNQWTPEEEEANEDLTPKDIEDYYASQDKDVDEDDQELLDFYASMSQEAEGEWRNRDESKGEWDDEKDEPEYDTLEPVEYDDSIRDDLSYGKSPNYESKAGEYEVDIQDGVAEEDLEDNAGLNTSDNQAGNVFNCPSCGFKTHNRDEYDAHNNTHGNVPATVDTPLSEENIAVQNNDYQLLSRFKQ